MRNPLPHFGISFRYATKWHFKRQKRVGDLLEKRIKDMKPRLTRATSWFMVAQVLR
jgi:hypothetical protein